jgi:hypothetical protein
MSWSDSRWLIDFDTDPPCHAGISMRRKWQPDDLMFVEPQYPLHLERIKAASPLE